MIRELSGQAYSKLGHIVRLKKRKKFFENSEGFSMFIRLEADVAREIRTADVIDRSVARIPMYQALDTIKVETSNKTVREIVDEIMVL